MIIFWRIVLVLSFILLGLIMGAWIGSQFFVTKSDGLVGGVIVLWYGVLGAIILLVISIILIRKLQGRSLSLTAIIFALIVISVYGIFTYKQQAEFQNELGSQDDYEAAGKFTVTMERLDLSDPFLFVKMEIDSRSRKWIQTGPAPKNEVFSASLPAKQLLTLREALNIMARLPADVLNNCNSDQGVATKRLTWHLLDTEEYLAGTGLIIKGSVNINAACLGEHFAIFKALQLVEKASQSPLGDLKAL